jgi:diaminopimelate decarboxylase
MTEINPGADIADRVVGTDAVGLPHASGPIRSHVLPDTATIDDDGQLSVGGVRVADLAREYGTPLFIYDEDHLRARCREAVRAFGAGAAYATKAFLCKAMARLAAEEGMALDVSTGGELAVVLAAGVSAERVVLHGNNKSEFELAVAIDAGVGRIIVDSFDEINRLERLTAGRREPVRVSIRATPGVEAHTHVYVMTGQEDSKFGFSVASGAADRALDRLSRVPGVVVDGVHAHIGSQIFRLDAYEEAIGALMPLITRHALRELSVGGGIGVAYLNGEESTSITEWARIVTDACEAAGAPGDLEVGAEPGRAIAAAAGMTCYTIGTIKELDGLRPYVAVDGGMSDNPRPVLYGSGYEAFLPERANEERWLEARVVGKHCESGDVIVPEAWLPRSTAVGDFLVTPVTGAYGYAMASNYNRVGRPPVLFVKDGEARVVVRREGIEDLLRLEP